MPGFMDRMRYVFRGETKAVGFSEWAEYFELMQVWARKSVTLETALQVSVALACGRVISEGIAMLPWKIMHRDGRNIQPALDHPLYDKLTGRPNDLQSAFEFKEQLGLHLAFTGNGYVYAPRVSGNVDQLYLLEPQWMEVRYRWPNPPTYIVTTDSGSLALTQAEVWHVRGPSMCAYMGLDFTVIARQALGLSMAIEEGQAKIQSQGVRMPGYISVEGNLTEQQEKKLQAWLQKNAGSQNAGRSMVLDRAAKFISTAMSNAEAQMIEMRKFQVEEVCRFMRVLPIMVGHTDKTATYASSEQMFLAHATYTLGPWANRIESSIDRWLLPERDRRSGYYSNLNEKALLRMTAKDQAEYLSRLTSGGIMTRNEGREVLDLNPLDGLDEPLTPVNTVAGDPPRADSDPNPPAGDE